MQNKKPSVGGVWIFYGTAQSQETNLNLPCCKEHELEGLNRKKKVYIISYSVCYQGSNDLTD